MSISVVYPLAVDSAHRTLREFRLWAPYAEAAELVLGDKALPMVSDGEFFEVTASAAHGDRYGFRILTSSGWSQVLADPESQWQPDGVSGVSAVVDSDFDWGTEDAFQPCFDVIYELHVGTFSDTGDFAGVTAALPYLADLGVTAIELMPVQPVSGRWNWGYDGVLFHAVSESYGGPVELKRLVKAAHANGIAVILDVVFNHFGMEGNNVDLFGPYSTSYTPWGAGVNLRHPQVRHYVLSAANRWLTEFRVDGLRLDATHAYTDPGILQEFSQLPGVIIAEDLQDDAHLPVDAQWNDNLHHALHTVVSGESHAYFAGFGSVSRLVAELRLRYPSVVYTTTHDQVGNRPRGDRPSMSLSSEQQILKIALMAALDAWLMLFMGEEYGARTPFPFFCDHENPRLRTDTVRFRNKMFIEQGLTETPIDPTSPEAFYQAIVDFRGDPVVTEGYRRILALRRSHPIHPQVVDQIPGTPVVVLLGDNYALLANCSDEHTELSETDLNLLSSSTQLANATVMFASPATHEPGQRVGDSTTLEPWSVLWLAVPYV